MFGAVGRFRVRKFRVRGYWAIACLLAAMGCKGKTAAPPQAPDDERPSVAFTDITESSGLAAKYDNGEAAGNRSIVESLGGGVGWLDFDGDGRADLLFPGGGQLPTGQPLTGQPTSLWRHSDDIKFVNVSDPARIAAPRTLTHGCSAADIDNDGFIDVLITGYGGLQLLHNQGDGTFVDVTPSSGLDDTRWSTSTAWGDFNQDSHLDLYVAHYVDWSWTNHPKCPSSIEGVNDVCSPNEFSPLPHTLYMSNGDGTFREASSQAGLEKGGKGLGVIVADFNRDQQVDIYVANDTTNNFLYRNDGQGHFTDIGLTSGTAVDGNGTPNGSMGLAVLDFNSDLIPDLWVTNYENETYALYLNGGDESFTWGTDRAGLTALGKLFVGFGTTAGDFDKDGDEDLVVANGHVILHPSQSTLEQDAVYLDNTMIGKQRRLNRVTFSDGYFARRHRGRGVVSGDIDRDGDLDLVFTNSQEPAVVLRNDTVSKGTLVQAELVGVNSNRNAIGATCVLITNQGKYLRCVVGGGSYLSQNSYTLSWGLPATEEVTGLEITWPDGAKQTINSPSKNTKQFFVVQSSVRSSDKK